MKLIQRLRRRSTTRPSANSNAGAEPHVFDGTPSTGINVRGGNGVGVAELAAIGAAECGVGDAAGGITTTRGVGVERRNGVAVGVGVAVKVNSSVAVSVGVAGTGVTVGVTVAVGTISGVAVGGSGVDVGSTAKLMERYVAASSAVKPM